MTAPLTDEENMKQSFFIFGRIAACLTGAIDLV